MNIDAKYPNKIQPQISSIVEAQKKEILPLVTTWMDLEGTSVTCSVVTDSLQPHGL